MELIQLIENFNKVIPKNKEQYNKIEKIKNLINELEYEIKDYFIENKLIENKNLEEIKNEIDKEKKMFNKLLFLYYFFEI